MKWINSEDFLRISSRVDAGEQHKDAENSLQADNNNSPSRGAWTEALVAGMGSGGRTGEGHTLIWGSRSPGGMASPRTRLIILGASPGSHRTGSVTLFYLFYSLIPAPVAVRVTLCLVLSFQARWPWCSKSLTSPLQRERGQGEAAAHLALPLRPPGPDI